MFYDFDVLGSTSSITESSGLQVAEYTYTPFGESLSFVEALSNRFEFVGRFGVSKDENGLSFMRARYFASSTGRFVSQDPIRLNGGDVNLYRYVQNNPLQLIDASGLFPSTSQKAAGFLGQAITVASIGQGWMVVGRSSRIRSKEQISRFS